MGRESLEREVQRGESWGQERQEKAGRWVQDESRDCRMLSRVTGHPNPHRTGGVGAEKDTRVGSGTPGLALRSFGSAVMPC